MERLTERYKDPIANTVLIKECGDKLCKNICDDIECDCSKCELEKALEKLATYEDLEEQGLLVRLPCKVGDTVYKFWYYDRSPYKIQQHVIRTLSEICELIESKKLGKSVFLTREEAVNKLEEMKNG